MHYGLFYNLLNCVENWVGADARTYADDEDYLHQIAEFVMLNTFAFNCFSVMARKHKLKTQNTPK